MEFCKECGNILLPKKKTNELFCRICNKSFSVEDKEKSKLEHYKKASNKKNISKEEKKRALKTAIIEQTTRVKSMTEEDREAFGELLEMSEE